MRNIEMSYYNVYYYCNIIDNLMYNFLGKIDWAPTGAQFTEPFFQGEIDDFPRHSALHNFCYFALEQLLYEDMETNLSDIQLKYDESKANSKSQRLKDAFKDERGNMLVLEVDKLLYNFSDKYESFYSYLENNEFDYIDDAYNDFCFLNSELEDSIERLVKELFYILFQNRDFLFRFNLYLSNSNKNRRERKQIPAWVKRAVKFRDRGRCVSCGKDLSGLIDCEDERSIHFDHIVSLDDNGLNDITNIQLLCQECNLKKSHKSFTSSIYKDWYSTD